MTPEDIEKFIRTNRPEPSPELRACILAAAAQVERPMPWWQQLKTWSAAALVLLAIDIAMHKTLSNSPHENKMIPDVVVTEKKVPVAHEKLAFAQSAPMDFDKTITLAYLRKVYLP